MSAAPHCACGAPKNAPSTLDFHNPACPRLERYAGETAALRHALRVILDTTTDSTTRALAKTVLEFTP